MKYIKYIDKNIAKQSGKTFAVTGATAGIGLALTKQLAYLNATVIMAVRNLDKANKVKEEILKEVPNAKLEILRYDQADFSSIEEFANKIKDRKIDCLVMNAAIFHPRNDKVTVDGYPLTIGTNYLGVYYLAHKLDSSFRNGNISRVVLTSSLVRVFGKTKHFEKYLTIVKNKPNRTYNVSKQMIYNFAGNLRIKYPNLEVILTHPGIAKTNIIKSDSTSFKWWFKVVGDRAIKTFANPAEKSSLCSLVSATKTDIKDINFIYPRGPLHYIGYPHVGFKKLDKIKNESLELVSAKIIGN